MRSRNPISILEECGMQFGLRIALVAAAIWLPACSQGGSLVLQNRGANAGPPLTGQEFVSGAGQHIQSTGAAGAGKYYMYDTIGTPLPQTRQQSIMGYTLYSSGQGVMDSYAK